MRKILIYILYFSLFFSAGCKIRRTVEGESFRQSWSELSGEVFRLTDLLRTDTLLQRWQRDMKGVLTVWSPPDSLGRQYKQAELQISSEESTEKEQRSYTLLNDTVNIVTSARQEEMEQEAIYEERTQDWRPGIRIVYVLIGGGLLLLSLFLYFRKKRE